MLTHATHAMWNLQEPNTELYRPALETLRTLIRTSTSSMTSVPKPLKFLHPLYPGLQELYETWSPSEDKVRQLATHNTLTLTIHRVYSPISSQYSP